MGGLIGSHEVSQLVVTYGYWAILLGVAVDSFGVPLPGEAMLLAAAVYAGATHRFALPLLIVAAATGAAAADNLSYTLGRHGGSRLLRRFGRFIRVGQRRQDLMRYVFGRYGAPVVTVGRFVPVVHIWTAFLAGANLMPWRRFVVFNAAGCVVWAGLLGGAGYALGSITLQIEAIILALAVPAAIAFGAAALLGLRLLERCIQFEADRSVELQDGDAA